VDPEAIVAGAERVPPEATRGGAETALPEFAKKMPPAGGVKK